MEVSIHDLIAEFIASGRRSRLAFCKERGIPYHKFKYHWRRPNAKTVRPAGKGFTRLKVKDTKAISEPVKSVTTARFFSEGRLTLEVQGEFSAHFLRELAGC